MVLLETRKTQECDFCSKSVPNLKAFKDELGFIICDRCYNNARPVLSSDRAKLIKRGKK